MSKESLEDLVLISVYDDLRDWHNLYPNLKPKNKIICDSYFSVVRSAEAGLGIAIGLTPVINRLINDNRLVSFDAKFSNTNYAYWLVSPKNNSNSEYISALYHWMKDLFNDL
jgi:LysR family glycine cleavage system transcriptional activator